MAALSTTDTEAATTAESVQSPGARLRKQREALGLEQSRVASQLHLSETMIEAIEWDDFEALPGMVFVQGYLKNYARLLGLSETEIMDLYHRVCPQPEQNRLQGKGPVNIKREVHSSHGLVQMASWFIGLGLIVLLVIWWQGRMDWEADPVDETTLIVDESLQEFEAESTLPEMVVSIDEQAGILQSDIPLTEDVSSEPVSDQSWLEAAEVTTDVVESAQQAQVPIAVSAVPTEPVSESVSDALQATESTEIPVEITTVTAGIESEEQEPAEPAVLPDQLQFTFNDRCWAEVRGSSGSALILGEIRPGIQHTLDANLGPFKIVLGNARAVSLTVKGEEYDLTPHIRGKVARFTLDPSNL